MEPEELVLLWRVVADEVRASAPQAISTHLAEAVAKTYDMCASDLEQALSVFPTERHHT
jgi:hypothetical protein